MSDPGVQKRIKLYDTASFTVGSLRIQDRIIRDSG